MTFERMIQQMDPNVYASLKQAVALRKWPDGRQLTPEQTELCMEAVMRYEIEHRVPENERVGHIGGACASSDKDKDDDGERITWVN